MRVYTEIWSLGKLEILAHAVFPLLQMILRRLSPLSYLVIFQSNGLRIVYGIRFYLLPLPLALPS